ncbi:uncharacterized protein HGUI_00470 [Hanseniaspora guilliermondii]|uniref:Uncharacterized protein n=1 Tax=Hanseniaspora guilliermondii TaxID=56406 RepID=A0A1L0FFB7_9ASCO|nr:uncharacterized protein HGUI_00470 [Hanseniaspora guilliermondii]
MFASVFKTSSKKLFHTSTKRQNIITDLYVSELKNVKVASSYTGTAPVKEFKPDAIIAALQKASTKDTIVANADTLKEYNQLEPTFSTTVQDTNDWYFKNELDPAKQGDWLNLQGGIDVLKETPGLGEKWVEENKAKYEKWE